MSKETLEQELARFIKVMESRQDNEKLLGLIDLIEPSSKFSQEAKPHCFGMLIKRCSVRLPDYMLTELIDKAFFSEAAHFMRSSSLTEEELEDYLAPMVYRLFKAVPMEPSAVGSLFYFVERSGLSSKRTDTFNYLFGQGMSEDEVGEFCDLNREDMKRFQSKALIKECTSLKEEALA